MAVSAEEVSAGIAALTREFETITHNLANVSTVGYKRKANAFSISLDTEQGYSPGAVDPDPALDFSQGNMVETGRPLDVALFGKGLFVIETPDGPLYTRNGTFATDENGQIVDSLGRIVAGETGPIAIPNNVGLSQVHVSSDGTVSAGGAAIGKFNIVDFGENESKLLPAGDSCYRMPDAAIEPVEAERVMVKQKFQEGSNVKIIEELVDMIFVTRLYEANVNSITSQQEATASLMSLAMG
ncbi:MAG: flagellar hook-basal body protein [Planctomycetota bacterium]|jgi:flagellar basal body rod protein FlgG